MILLSIIGEDISRIVPVIHAYQKKIKQHILLCDDTPANLERAKKLQRGMQRFSAKHTLGWYTKVITIDEDDANTINEVAKQQFRGEGSLWLNATDGYPAITILLTRLIHNDGGLVLSYNHFDNDLHIIKPDGSMSCQQLETRMNLDDYITLLNYSTIEKKTKDDLLSRKEEILSLYSNEKIFYENRKQILQKHFNPTRKSFKLNNNISTILKRLQIITKDNKLIPSKQKELQGDLLEEYIFWLCEELEPDDIAMGIKIDFDGETKHPEVTKRIFNEFDILLIHKNRIYTIECKFSEKLKGLDFVYKYDAILDYFGNTSKAIIANISSNKKESYFDTNSSISFSHSTLRRARMANVAIYHESYIHKNRFQDLIKKFFLSL